jgi:alanine racemase
VTIKDKKAPIIGSICMDMLMVDVTDIDCQEGQEVLLFGKDPSVTYMAKQLGTIPYEIMTSISQRVKRIFYRE